MRNAGGPTPTLKVVFDLDGTILDSMPGIARDLFAHSQGQKPGNQPGDRARPLSVSPHPLSESQFFEHYASRFDAVFSDLAAAGVPREVAYAAWVAKARSHTDNPGPFPGIPTLLKSLRQAQMELFVWTTRDRATKQDLLAHAGLLDLFVACACGDSGFPPKPSPAALLHLLGDDWPRQQAVLVGDGVSDIEAGQRLGCKTVGAAWCRMASIARLVAAGANTVAATPSRCGEVLLKPSAPVAAPTEGSMTGPVASEQAYTLLDLVLLLGMKTNHNDVFDLVRLAAQQLGLGTQQDWVFDDAIEILGQIANGSPMNRILARCAIAKLYALRSKRRSANILNASPPPPSSYKREM